MAKTKTRDEVMSEAYWTPKEKENLNSKYSTSLVKENCNQEEMKDKSLPSDAYIVTYKIGDAVRNDLVRCHGKVNILCRTVACISNYNYKIKDKYFAKLLDTFKFFINSYANILIFKNLSC